MPKTSVYVDVGNTLTKLQIVSDSYTYNKAYPTKWLESVDTFYHVLPQSFKNNKILKSVWVCSVVPRAEIVVVQTFEKYWQTKVCKVGFPLRTGVDFKVTNPKSVGHDLVALSVFLASKNLNAIMVNMGTATTITYVKNKTLMGVVIAPGLTTSASALVRKTAAIPQVKLDGVPSTNVGVDTSSAVRIGVIKGHAGMVRTLVNKIDEKACVYLSGGNAMFVRKLLPYHFVQEATLAGIKIVAELNEH